jgi:hypothetical protein
MPVYPKAGIDFFSIWVFQEFIGAPAEESVFMSVRLTTKPTTKTVTAKGGFTR